MFGINGTELIILVVVALIVIGPKRLPEYAAQLREFVRGARRMAEGARQHVKEDFGEDLSDLDWERLDPRQYDPRRIVKEALAEEDAALRAERRQRESEERRRLREERRAAEAAAAEDHGGESSAVEAGAADSGGADGLTAHGGTDAARPGAASAPEECPGDAGATPRAEELGLEDRVEAVREAVEASDRENPMARYAEQAALRDRGSTAPFDDEAT